MKSAGVYLWICAVLASLVVFICIRIEILNHRAGGVLPRDFSEYPSGANRKWRYRTTDRESVRRQFARFYGSGNDGGEELRLPPDVAAEIEEAVDAWIEEALPNNELHDAVATIGLLQYLLSPLSILLSGILVARWRDEAQVVAGGVFLTASCLAFAVMLYRGYFPSLGW